MLYRVGISRDVVYIVMFFKKNLSLKYRRKIKLLRHQDLRNYLSSTNMAVRAHGHSGICEVYVVMTLLKKPFFGRNGTWKKLRDG